MNENRPTGLNALDCPICGEYVEDSHVCPIPLDCVVTDKDGFICSPSVIPMTRREAVGMVAAWDSTHPFGAPHRVMRLVPDGPDAGQ